MTQPNCASTSKQSLNASEKQASNSQWLNVILGSNKLTFCVERSHQKEFLHKQKKSDSFFIIIPRLSEKLSPFFKLLKETSQFCIPNAILHNFNELNQQLEKSCSLALKQPIKNKQLNLMTDSSSFQLMTAAGYAIMIERMILIKNFCPEGKLMPQLLLDQKRSIQHKSKCQYTEKNS